MSAAIDIQPLHDPERIVVAALLASPELVDLVRSRLAVQDFYGEPARACYTAILRLADERTQVTHQAVWTRICDEGQMARLGQDRAAALATYAQITEETPDLHVRLEPFIERIIDRSRLRRIAALATKVAAEAKTATRGAQDIADRALEQLREVADRREMTTIVHVSDALREKFEAWTQAAQEGRTAHGLRTGFSGIDELLGGLRGAKLYVLAARPGEGKSALALNIATNVSARGAGVAVFSLEMTRDEITDRQLAALSGVPGGVIANPERLTDETMGRIRAATEHLRAHSLWIDDAPSMSLSDIRAKARRVDADIKRAGGRGLELAVVDYLQLMAEPSGIRSREQAVAANSRGLKVLAGEMKIPVLVLCQLNRAVEQRGGKPRLSDLRESGAIEQDADAVMFLNRENIDPDRRDGPTDLIVAKHRGGRTGSTPLIFYGATTRFAQQEGRYG